MNKRRKSKRKPLATARRLRVEALESRRLLAVFHVTTFDDTFSSNDGLLSLREAITEANNNGDASVDEIVLQPGTYHVTRTGATESNNLTGDLDINDPMIIRGSGQGVTIIDGGGDAGIGERVFQTLGTNAITFQDLTITGGRARSPQNAGGGIYVSGGAGSLVTLERVTVSGNTAERQGGGLSIGSQSPVNVVLSNIIDNEVTAGDGGGIANFGSIAVDRSTIANNTSSGQAGGLINVNATSRIVSSTLSGNESANGGAITNYNGDTTVVNSTISGNQATSQAGAIFNISSGAGNVGSATLLQSTVTGNTSSNAASVHSLSQNSATSAPIRIGNSIVAGNTSSFGDVGDFNTAGGSGATIVSLGNNLSNNGANGRLNQPSDLLNVTAPVLGPLSDNGGPTQTHALIDSTSNPAIDAGNGSLAVDPGADGVVGGNDDTPLVADQRAGFVRSSSNGVDIGAFELVRLGGDDLVVTSSDDTLLSGDANVTLRDAIFAANRLSGTNTVDATGVTEPIVLSLGQLDITDSVTIIGGGQATTVIDANQRSRVLNVVGESVDVTLQQLTLTGGRTTGSNEFINGTRETTYSGGGIRFDSAGTLGLIDSTLSGNSTAGEGAYGGAISTRDGSVTLTGSTLSSNSTAGDSAKGGGIYTHSGSVTLTGSTLSDNSTAGRYSFGGGIRTSHGSVTLTGSTLSGNSTAGTGAYGGGIYTFSGSVTLTGSTLSGNSTGGVGAGGGGVFMYSGSVTLRGSTVTGNVSSGRGGGIDLLNFVSDRSLTIHNSIVAGNTDAEGAPDFVAPGDPANNLDVKSSLIGDSAGTSLADSTTPDSNGNVIGVDWTTVLASHTVDDVVVPHLTDNGGPVPTVALLPSTESFPNPAIDTGDVALAKDPAGNDLTTDGRGAPFARIAGASVDMGAYEFQIFPAAAFVVTTHLDELDFSNNTGTDPQVSLREAIVAANGSFGADEITFSGTVTNPFVLGLGELKITDDVTITGGGQATTVIDANQQSRVLNVVGESVDVTLQQLTLTGGRTTGSNEFINGALETTHSGGGIRFESAGTLGLIDSTLSGNSTTGDYANGGGIYTFSGSVTLTGSTISGNRTAGDRAHGGGIGASRRSVTLTSSTLSGNSTAGDRAHGGGISTNSGSVTLTRSTLSGNSTTGNFADGGGISTSSGSVTLTGSTLSGNSTAGRTAFGGGIRTSSGSVTLTSSTLSGNSTTGDVALGGGINSYNGSVTLTGSTLSGNSTAGDSAFGGGIMTTYGSVTLTGSTLSGNSTIGDNAYGGGIFTGSGSVTLTDSTLSGNSTAGDRAAGGGIYTSSGSVTLTGSTLSGNSTAGDGADSGGIQSFSGSVTLTGSTVTGNVSSGLGGGIRMQGYILAESLTIHNSIVAGNTDAGGAPDFVAPGDPGRQLDVQSSLIGDSANTSLVDSSTPDSNGNIIGVDWTTVLASHTVNTIIVPLLTDNGGPVQTVALVPSTESFTNPAIDAGSNALAKDPEGDDLTTDGRGLPFVRIAGGTVDIGAYELQTLPAAAFVVTTHLDELDFTNNNGADPQVSLREAIVAANGSFGADEITFSGTVTDPIVLGLGELLITDDVTITGLGQATTVIDANQQSRVMNVVGESVDVTLQQLTLSGGRTTGSNEFINGRRETTYSGGGIRFESSGTLALIDSTLSGNSTGGDSANGGGIYTSSGSVTLTGSTLSDNRTTGDFAHGGGINTHDGSVTLTGSTLSGNSTAGYAARGGGIYTYRGSVTLTGSTLSGNRTAGYVAFGGGIHTSSGSVTITGSTLSGNSTAGYAAFGGGIRTSSGSVTLTSSTLSGNRTTGDLARGGGIYTLNGSVTLTGSTLSGNSTGGDSANGGGIYNRNGLLALIGSTITGNVSSRQGGGIVNYAFGINGSLTIHNSIVAGNMDDGTAPDFVAPGDPGRQLDVQASLIGDSTGTSLIDSSTPDANGNLIGVDWKTVLASRTVDSQVVPHLTDNGGPVQTVALLSNTAATTNPAIDRGNNSLAKDPAGNDLTTDARGLPRITDGDGDGTATVDMGAFESPLLFATLDFGDAPISFPVTEAQDGARHTVGDLFLGSGVSAEYDGIASPTAASDTNDDGVTLLATAIASTTSATRSSLAIVASAAGKLDAWIDFDGDGTWQAAEQIFDSVDVSAGANTLSYQIPAGATASGAAARFRLSSAGDLDVTSAASDGEVEDFIATITAAGNSTVNVTSITPGTVTIEESGSDVVVREGSTILFQGPAASLAVLDFTGTNGNDTLLLNASLVDFPGTVGFHGGTGRDTLQVAGSGQSIDTSDLPADSINGLEVIDLRGTGDNQLSLSEQDVSAIPDAGQTLRIVKDYGDTINFRSGTFKIDSSRVEAEQLIITAKSGANTIEFAGSGWTNPINRLDVNGSGTLEPIDVLQVLNELGRKSFVQPGTSTLVAPESLGDAFPMKFYDTSGDNQVAPIDALRIINAIGRGEGKAPSGEAFDMSIPAVPQASQNQDAEEDDQREAVDLAILQWLGERH